MLHFAASNHPRTLVANIGSAGISLALVECTPARAVMQTALHAELPLENRTKEQAMDALKQLLVERGAQLLKDSRLRNGQAIKQFFIILQSPWSESRIVAATSKFETARYITQGVLDECARRALGAISSSPEFLSAGLLQVLLNGYRTDHPEKKIASTAEVIGIASTADMPALRTFTQGISQIAPNAALRFRSGIHALIRASRPLWATVSDMLVVYLSTEGTEIMSVQGGVPLQSIFVPAGIRSILEQVRPTASVADTLALLKMKARRECSDAVRAELDAAFAKKESEIARIFGEALAKGSFAERLPNKAILITSPYIGDWFKNFFERVDFAQFTFTAQPFDVRIPDPLFSSSFQDVAPDDLDLALAVAFAHEEDNR